ncbi:hypothetical protein Amsp01_058770 [Amycolatopsis sp. NBRC 101858]|nr:hypothetical protein Amsp01_058770 [Amycolatopsis sp. NBRC 101858]
MIALATAGSIRMETGQFPLSAAEEAFARLRNGHLRGRAVLLPD